MDNATLGSSKSQNPKYLFSPQPQIYGEQALDHRYQYIGGNNLETLLNAIEVAPADLTHSKCSYQNRFTERSCEKQSMTNRGSHEKQTKHCFQHDENQRNLHMQEQPSPFHSNRLLPPPVTNSISSPRKSDLSGALTPAAMSISSLIDLEQPIQGSTPLTPPDTTLNIFPGLSTSPTKISPATSPIPLASMLPSAPMSVPSPTDSIPFPRLQPSPPSNIFLNTFPLPGVNQAIGEVDRTRHSPPPLISNPNKRKWDSTDSSIMSSPYLEESLSKIRRPMEDYMNEVVPIQPRLQYHQIDGSSSSPYQMTTVTCQHATVAQKSYGSEKRFLCPPPVVMIERPHNDCRNLYGKPEVTMSVVCENGDRSLEQKTLLDENLKGTFKYLHVSGTAKAKYFELKLKIFTKNSTIPYAVFKSAPVTIISKPSKKTAKARNVSSCILSGCHVSLFNRINSQTVRTKYMGIEGGQLCAKNSSWSSFIITVMNSNDNNNNNNHNGLNSFPSTNVQKGSTSSSSQSSNNNCSNSIPVTYGSEVILSDPTTGYTSDRLIIRKVEKGRITQGACGPVSQMQKIALQCVRSSRCESHYLSAAGPITMDSPHSQDQCTVSGASPYLGYQSSRVVHMQNVEFTKEPFRMVSMQNVSCAAKNDHMAAPTIVEEVDDYLCWTIVGICKFQYTLCEPLPTTSTPSTPISQ
ncbi:12779_t:CDS:2 [Funneliformis geosporum]|uniref:19494_t:CDS:1 n=1 Tax=Funneliformis geosporum TaxID=1117311 RepID=A0A9W4WWQ3_9GLOM|nr:19494_t:CDS:2 [Funneliformis geosporum]CAI2170773.1 12779_t:CDS:2 [Funneliformis geosporum]